MRILIDLRCLETPSGQRGVGRYTRELVSHLAAARPPDWQLLGMSWSKGILKDLEVEWVAYPGPRRAISYADPFILPRLLRRREIDLYHSPVYTLPSRRGHAAALVLTVHDLVADILPEVLSRRHRLVFKRTFRSAGRAHRVITVSEATRHELTARYRVPAERVVAVPEGVRPELGVCDTRAGSGFPRPFLLYVGGFDRSKNVPLLIDVLTRCLPELPELSLVLAGGDDDARAGLRRRAGAAGLADRVVLPGFIEDRRLAAAYREAAVFVFPSRYEGFGLPPLEAMAAGCPVVSAPSGALEENLEGAALLADPDAPGTWTEHVLKLCLDDAARERLIAAGRERAASFVWSETARLTLEVYRNALAAASSGGA